MRGRSGLLIAFALIAGFLSVVSLVLPWFDLLGKERSSIDLVSSASALDVIDGGVKVLVLLGWFLAPLLVSVAMFLAAAGRHRFAAALLVPIGFVMVIVFVAGSAVDEIGIAWGAIFGVVFAGLSTVFAIMVLATPTMAQPTVDSVP